MKKNILFITGQFVPYTQSVGGIIRVYSFLQTLKKKYNLYLLSNSGNYKGYLGLSKKSLDRVHITYLNHRNLILKLNIFKFFNFIKYFKNFLYLLSLDYNFSYSSSYYQESLKIIQLKKIDYIIISAPPFSLFFLIKKIKKNFPHIKIIVDYRDGWTGRINSLSLLTIKTIVRNFIEKKILYNVDIILAATVSIKKNLSNITKKKIILLTNGYLLSKKNKTKPRLLNSKKIIIGYFGLISDNPDSYRDITILYKLLNHSQYLQKKYIFYFFGNNYISNNSIKNFNCFRFKKNIAHNKVLQVMSRMDYLMCLHTELSTSKEVITGKLYDYIASKKPIIFISAGDTEAAKIIKKYHLGFSINFLKSNLELFLKNLKKYNYFFNKNKNISIFSRTIQNKKLFKILR